MLSQISVRGLHCPSRQLTHPRAVCSRALGASLGVSASRRFASWAIALRTRPRAHHRAALFASHCARTRALARAWLSRLSRLVYLASSMSGAFESRVSGVLASIRTFVDLFWVLCMLGLEGCCHLSDDLAGPDANRSHPYSNPLPLTLEPPLFLFLTDAFALVSICSRAWARTPRP